MSHTYFTGTWATGDAAHAWWYRIIMGSIMLLSGFSTNGWKHHIIYWWKSWLIPNNNTIRGSVDSFQGASWRGCSHSFALRTGSSVFKMMQPCSVKGGSQVLCSIVRKQLAIKANTFASDGGGKGRYLSERKKNVMGQANCASLLASPKTQRGHPFKGRLAGKRQFLCNIFFDFRKKQLGAKMMTGYNR